jgi:hypothetical protein
LFYVDYGGFQAQSNFALPEDLGQEQLFEYGFTDRKEYKVTFSLEVKSFFYVFENGLQLSEINKKSRIKINVHPGFLTTITQGIDDSRKKSLNVGNFRIEVDNIDNIYYLDHVDKMCDALIRLLRYSDSKPTTSVPSERISELCKKQVSSKGNAEVKEVKEVVAKGDNVVLTDNTMFAEPDEGAITFDFENQDKLEEIANTGDAAVEDLLFGDMFDEESEGEGEGEEGEDKVETPKPKPVVKEAEAEVESPVEEEQEQEPEEASEKEDEPVVSGESGDSGQSIEDIKFEEGSESDEGEGEGEG